jgi:uncharacterized PurR-regulated membrane protein YhhQ (DUF165 family)
MNTRITAPLLGVALVGSIALANWLTSHFGLIPAGFGLLVTAGTYAAGLALGLRDVLHEAGGVRWVLAALGVGIAASLLLGDGRIAVASAVAFALAELIDLAVYAPLRRRQWHTAVFASNTAGAVVDTLVFLAIAGFPITWATVGGQLLVKAIWVTVGFLAVAEVLRRALPRQRLVAESA